MRERRARIAAGATVLGLGALGAAAMGSNHGMPAATQAGTNGAAAAVTTTASGTALPVSQATSGRATTRPPIVTRASGAGPATFDD